MPRPTSREPTDGELEILNVLWERGPAELGAVCEALRTRREIATTTVATMLKIMLDKGLVSRVRGSGRAYRWQAEVTQRSARRQLLDKLLSSAFDGSSKGLLAHLVEDGDLTLDEWDEVRRMIERGGDDGERNDG